MFACLRGLTLFLPTKKACLFNPMNPQAHATPIRARMEGPVPLTLPVGMCVRALPTTEAWPARLTHHVSTTDGNSLARHCVKG